MKRSLVHEAMTMLVVPVVVVGCSGGAVSPSSGGPGIGEDPEGEGASMGEDGGSSGGRRDGEAPRPKDGGDGGGSEPEDDDAEIGLTFQGCSPVFDDVRVVTNVVAFDSLAVTNAYAPINGGIQIAIKDPTPRSVVLSTTQRTQSQNSIVINVYAGGVTHTNLCNPSGGCTYNAQQRRWDGDPIAGTFILREYDPKEGKLDVEFKSVVLQSMSGSALCTVNGTLRTKRLSK